MSGFEADAASDVPWNALPKDILQLVGLRLNGKDLKEARLACTEWRVGISFGVTNLRPLTVPHAGNPHLQSYMHSGFASTAPPLGALAALVGVPPTLGAFPNIRTLDLRRTSIAPFQLRQLAGLAPGVRHIQLTYLERFGRPLEYFDHLKALYKGLGELSSRFAIELELHVNEAPYSRSFMLSDLDLAKMVDVPPQVALTSLQFSNQMTDGITAAGLAPLMALRSLRHLEIVTYCGDREGLDNSDFRQLSVLTGLEHLHIGILKRVTGEAMAEGLANCKGLTCLELKDCSSLKEKGFRKLVAAVPGLRTLKLTKCPWLTNTAILHLKHLQALSELVLIASDQVTGAALNLLAAKGSLRIVEVRRMRHVGPKEVEALFALEGIESVNDRCKLAKFGQRQLLPRCADTDFC